MSQSKQDYLSQDGDSSHYEMLYQLSKQEDYLLHPELLEEVEEDFEIIEIKSNKQVSK